MDDNLTARSIGQNKDGERWWHRVGVFVALGEAVGVRAAVFVGLGDAEGVSDGSVVSVEVAVRAVVAVARVQRTACLTALASRWMSPPARSNQ